jgi:hypothetical protein
MAIEIITLQCDFMIECINSAEEHAASLFKVEKWRTYTSA